jgi:hypothetical protein
MPGTDKVHRSNLVKAEANLERPSSGLFDPRVDLAAERPEIDWLGKEGFGTAFQHGP